MRRFLVALPLLLALAACASSTRDLEEPTEPMGDFRIGHIGVVAPNLQKLLVSRDATEEEWIKAVEDALGERFSRFEGDKYYHLGVSVEAYSLPPPIIPGKSAVALNVTLWDDAAQAKMNSEPKQIHVIKVFESRISKNRDQQLTGLAEEAARLVEVWLREMQESDGWFMRGDPGDPGVAEQATAALPLATDVDATPLPATP
ncbi:hypothetical protein [uncultured Marivita sp.]|uniref:hypothetical protein n=1 Tax=uncultured Marivita sp. TaxID=888080 RepID=UPI00262B62D8|nr:hypothetical protein [uncultured Marivita sp.]